MKIAIIENQSNQHEYVKKRGSELGWEVEHFTSPSELGKADLDDFDVIISDYSLPTINGRDLIKSIAPKTEAQLLLMSSHESFLEEDVDNDRIKGLIDKDDPNNIIDHLKYIDVKLRINRIIEEESNKFKEIIPPNGFKIEDAGNDIALIKITDLLSDARRSALEKELEERGFKKAAFYFPNADCIPSMYLNLLIYFYKFFNRRKGKITFWNYTGKDNIEKQLKLCNLTNLFPVFNLKAEAIKYLLG